MKKVLFFITNLNIGGAERVLVDTVNNLNYDITVLTLYGKGDLSSELKVKRKSIFKSNIKNSFIQKIIGLLIKTKFYKKYIYNKYIKDKYDVEIAYLEGPSTEILSISNNPNKYAFVHTDLSIHYKNKNYQYIYNYYKKFKKIIFVSDTSLKGFNKLIPNNFEKEVIKNYIDENRIKKLSLEKTDCSDYFLVIARFREEKGVLKIIDIFKNRNDKLIIIGDGPLFNSAKEMIKTNDNIILLGSLTNPYSYLKKAKALIIPSLYEGDSTVAKEGMILNKFIISTNTSVKNTIKDYPNKIIDNDLNKSIDYYLENSFKIKDYKYQNNNLDKMKKLIEGSND